jgi:hypothetical protein
METDAYVDAERAHREGQQQRGEPVSETLEPADIWNLLTQRNLAFGVPFVLVSAGLVLAGLCSRKPHLIMGRSVVPRRHQSTDTGLGCDQGQMALLDVTLAGFYTGLLGLACSGVTGFQGFSVVLSVHSVHFGSFGFSVLKCMPVEQLVAVFASAAATAILLPSVRPLPAFGCALGACGIAGAAFAYSLVGIDIAKCTDASAALDDVLELFGLGQGHAAEAQKEAEAAEACAVAARGAAAAAATAMGREAYGSTKDWLSHMEFLDACPHRRALLSAENEKLQHERKRFEAVTGSTNSAILILCSALTVFHLRIAGSASRASLYKMCRVASGARSAGFIAGYGLFKLGLTAGPVGDEQ